MQKLLAVLAGVFLLSLLGTRVGLAKNPVIEQFFASRLGTISTEAEPVFTDGTLIGCALNFMSLARDNLYNNGNIVRVDGSFNLMAAKNNLGILLKIVLNDLNPRTGDFVPSAPVTAFFVSGNSTSKPFFIKEIGSDTPGAIFVAYSAEKTFPMLFKSVNEGTVTVAFARAKGGTDMQVPIELAVESTDNNGEKHRSNKSANGFSTCVKDLLDAERARLNAN